MLFELLQTLTATTPAAGLPIDVGDMFTEGDMDKGGKKEPQKQEKYPLAKNEDVIELNDKGNGEFELKMTQNGQEDKVTLDISHENGESQLTIRDGANPDTIKVVEKITSEFNKDLNISKGAPSSSPAAPQAGRVVSSNVLQSSLSILMALLYLPIA